MPAYLFFLLSTILVVSHVSFAGYFLFLKMGKFMLTPILLTAAVGICLILFISSINNPVFWFYWLIIVFLLAMLVHIYSKRRTDKIYLQEYCNYKIYVEITSIISCLVGILLCKIFPQQLGWVGLLTFICIVEFDRLIFFKKKLYSMKYPNFILPQDPLVTIVVIAYNEEKYIGQTLESIKIQDYKNYEVVVVDDHSVDKTVEIAKSFESAFPLKIVQKPIRGPSRSRNFGATFARGELILFIDADVILPLGFLSENIRVFQEKKLSVAGVDFDPYDKKKIDNFIIAFYRRWLKDVQYYNPRGIGFCLLVATELHKKVNFDESIVMSEDFDYIRRACQLGKFRMIDAVPVRVSWRRFQKENRFILILKYLFFEWYRQNIGEIRKKLLPYEFGHYKEKPHK